MNFKKFVMFVSSAICIISICVVSSFGLSTVTTPDKDAPVRSPRRPLRASSNLNSPNAAVDSLQGPPSQKIQKTVVMQSSFLSYSTLALLEKNSDLVIVGRPVQDFLDRKHVTTYYHGTGSEIQSFYTLTNIDVEKVLKGTINTEKAVDNEKESDAEKAVDNGEVKPQNILQIAEPIGLFEERPGKKVKLEKEGYKELKAGKRYILYFKKIPEGIYFLVNRNLGKFNLDGGDPDDLQGMEATGEDTTKLKLRESVLAKYKDKLK